MTSPRAVAVVLAADDSTRMAWAISGALATARRLARGRKVLLADLQCRTPSALAEALGAEETPGIVDVLFRGASFGSVVRRPAPEPFTFLPCGEDPPSPAEVYRHPGWERIAGRFQGKKVVFLACVSADDWAEMGPIPGFEACIVFNGTGGAVRLPRGARKITEVGAPSEAPSGQHGADSRLGDPATTGATVPAEPPTGFAAHPWGAGEPAEADGPLEAVAPLAASTRDPATPATTGPAAGAEFPESAADRSPPSSRRSPTAAALRTHLEYIESLQRRRLWRKRLIYGALVAAVAIALAATTWVTVGARCTGRVNAEGSGDAGWGEVARCVVAELGSLAFLGDSGSEHAPISLARTDRGGSGAALGAASPACGEAEPGCAGRDEGRTLPYSVVVGEFSTLDEARRHLQESGGLPVPFYVAPTGGEEGVRYRLFAGLLSDRLDAEEMLSRLVYSGMKDSLKESDIKRVRYAFSFGIYGSEAEAHSLLDRLLEHGVPGYLVPAAAAGGGGGPAYRVYAGAFESPVESTSLLDSIRRAGLTAELVERTGLLPD